MGDPNTGKQLYSRSSLTEVNVLSPRSGSLAWVLAMWGEAPRESVFEGQWGLITRIPQDWGKQKHHSWSSHTGFHVHQGAGKKVVTSQDTGQDLPASIGGTPVDAGDSYVSLWGQGHWRQQFWSALIGVSPLGGCNFLTKTWPHPTACRLSAGTPQDKQATRQEHSPTHQ